MLFIRFPHRLPNAVGKDLVRAAFFGGCEDSPHRVFTFQPFQRLLSAVVRDGSAQRVLENGVTFSFRHALHALSRDSLFVFRKRNVRRMDRACVYGNRSGRIGRAFFLLCMVSLRCCVLSWRSPVMGWATEVGHKKEKTLVDTWRAFLLFIG